MTILENIYCKGFECNGQLPGDWQTVTVAFLTRGKECSVDFTVQNLNRKVGVCDLYEQFKHYCQQNGYSLNSVLSVTIKKVADSLSELLNPDGGGAYEQRN